MDLLMPMCHMIFDHREPLLSLSTQFAFSFQICAVLPFSSLSGDPGRQANPQGSPTLLGNPSRWPRQWISASEAGISQWHLGIRKRKAELKMSAFDLMLRPFFTLYFCFISSISLFPCLWQFSFTPSFPVFLLTKGTINILAIAALGQDGSQEMDLAGCVEHSWKKDKQRRLADLAAMKETKGWGGGGGVGHQNAGGSGWRGTTGSSSPGDCQTARVKEKKVIQQSNMCLCQVE